ncbi:hypothetical protein [Sphingobacterium sp. G1-14]|uniref:hypothetical protein n=1 Tax=Sphingobacterium sp. G1-14 TaxID=2003121 RepID=UPI000B49295B|nr:hypothetical protein [Sphingobacterium sp. G1-14]
MSNILFVFEGEKTEDQIVTSFTKHVFKDRSVITCAFCAEIYQLHRALADDGDLDTFSLLKNIPNNKEILKDFNRDDFAEIYLFFDYDGHSTLASDDALFKMLEIFDEETDLGKLYISYPMVESIKHFSDELDFKNLKVEAKENIKYKKLVSEEAGKIYLQFSKYTMEIWKSLLITHLSKMNYIVTDNYILPNQSFTQGKIFENQKEKYIEKDSTISVLSGFPIFMFDYFGFTKFSKIIG